MSSANTARPAEGVRTGDSDAALGRTIRALRLAQGLTLAQLGERIDRTAGYLSQVENGRTQPTLEVLRKLATVFSVSMNWFFPPDGERDPDEADVIVRGEHSKRLILEEGIRHELLSPDMSGPIELLRTVLQPGSVSGEPGCHRGHEAGYVLDGELELVLEGRVFRLGPGDSFSFESSREHAFSNPTAQPTVVLWVLTPPVL